MHIDSFCSLCTYPQFPQIPFGTMAKNHKTSCSVPLSALILFTCIVLFASKSLIPSPHLPENICRHSCEKIEKYAAPKQNVWSDLSDAEFEDLLGFLYGVPNELNLTRVGNATS
jgi:hypothetical protein